MLMWVNFTKRQQNFSHAVVVSFVSYLFMIIPLMTCECNVWSKFKCSAKGQCFEPKVMAK